MTSGRIDLGAPRRPRSAASSSMSADRPANARLAPGPSDHAGASSWGAAGASSCIPRAYATSSSRLMAAPSRAQPGELVRGQHVLGGRRPVQPLGLVHGVREVRSRWPPAECSGGPPQPAGARSVALGQRDDRDVVEGEDDAGDVARLRRSGAARARPCSIASSKWRWLIGGEPIMCSDQASIVRSPAAGGARASSRTTAGRRRRRRGEVVVVRRGPTGRCPRRARRRSPR